MMTLNIKPVYLWAGLLTVGILIGILVSEGLESPTPPADRKVPAVKATASPRAVVQKQMDEQAAKDFQPS